MLKAICLFIYSLVKEKKVTMTDSNETLQMEDKDKERLYHETVKKEFLFAKSLTKALSEGKENIAPEKEIIEEIIKNLESLLEESL